MRSIESIIMMCSAAAGAGAFLLLLFAWRGRRIDDHPVCRKCGFDLFGLPATSTRCPECGRDLSRRHAVRRGHRRKRVRLIALSTIVLVAAMIPLSLPLVIRARGLKWIEQEPLAWLIRNAQNSPSAGTRDTALDEILRRLGAGKLSKEQVDELAEIALAHQADRSQPWQIKWGLFVEAVETRGQLSAAAWDRYRTQAADRYEVEVRDTLRPGFAFPVRVRLLPERVGTAGRFAYFPQITYHIDGQVFRPLTEFPEFDSGRGADPSESGYLDRLLPFPPKALMSLKPGKHQAGATINVTVVEDRWRNGRSGRAGRSTPGNKGFWSPGMVPRPSYSAPELTYDDLVKGFGGTSGELRRLKAFTLVDDPTPQVTMVYDEPKSAVVRGAVAITVRPNRRTGLAVEFRSTAPPVDLAFSARLMSKDSDYDLGSLVLRADQNERFTLTVDLGPDLRGLPERVNVILRPDPEAAEYTVDVKRIWAGVLEFSDVDVAAPNEPGPASPTKKRR